VLADGHEARPIFGVGAVRRVGICDENPGAGGDGGGEGREAGEEVGDGFRELAGVEEAGVGVVEGFGGWRG